MLTWTLFATLESALEVCTSAEDSSVAGDDGAFDARVDVNESEGLDELGHHDIGEGVVFSWAVEGDEDYGCWSW